MRKTNAFSFLTALAVVATAALTPAPAPAQAPGQGAFDRKALIEAARKEGKLVWYATISEEQITQILKRFRDTYPFIKTGSVRASSGRIKARLDAELATNRVQGDVLQMGSFGQFMTYAKSGNLERFVTPEMDAYDPGYKDQGVWTVFRNSPIILAYNTRRMKQADLPKSWKDLLSPKYKGQIGFIDSTAGGQHVGWYVVREKYGPEYWQKMAENQPIITASPAQVIDGLLSGEYQIAACAQGYTVLEYQQNGAPVQYIVPEDIVPILVSPIGIIKGAPNPNAARLFIDWILSKEGQTAMVEIMNDYSPRSDVVSPKGMPAWKALTTKQAPDNWDKFVASTPEFVRDFDRLPAQKKR